MPRGALTELVGPPSCGRLAALLTALQQITSTGEPAALVDQGGHLDPQGAFAAGVELEHLLWVRPQRLPDTLAAAELLLSTGFPLVAVDLGLPPVKGRAPLAAWLRLARRATEHQSVVLVGSPYRMSGCAARAVVKAGRSRGAWSGHAGEVRALKGLRGRFELAKHRNHQPNESIIRLTLTLPEAAFGAAVESAAMITPNREEFSNVQCK